jgi:hypothetical protein
MNGISDLKCDISEGLPEPLAQMMSRVEGEIR